MQQNMQWLQNNSVWLIPCTTAQYIYDHLYFPGKLKRKERVRLPNFLFLYRLRIFAIDAIYVHYEWHRSKNRYLWVTTRYWSPSRGRSIDRERKRERMEWAISCVSYRTNAIPWEWKVVPGCGREEAGEYQEIGKSGGYDEWFNGKYEEEK